MTTLCKTLVRHRFHRLGHKQQAKQQGVTMIEYALIAALIAVVLVVVLGTLGTELSVTFEKIRTTLAGANA